jgi:hypothetical protein
VEIKVIAIDTNEVGRPRNDGTAGSGLYRVPLKLSARPSALWAEVFPHVWNRPPQWTTMHRPGIARVVGDQIVLDGTTIEEVRDYHLSTLKLVVSEVNSKVSEIEAQRETERDRKEAEERAHEQHVRDVAAKIKIDE